MPAPRAKRVPPELARVVFRRLARSGDLRVITDLLWDRKDDVRGLLDKKLSATLMTDSKQLAEVQAYQGAFRELEHTVGYFSRLAADEPEDGARDAGDGRPSSNGHRKRTVARF